MRCSDCGADPSFVVGGTVPQLGGGSHSGKGRSFVAEACEFDRSFHNLRPRVAVDHQHRSRPPRLLQGHRRDHRIVPDFASLVPADGLILANGNDQRVSQGDRRTGDAGADASPLTRLPTGRRKSRASRTAAIAAK